MSASYEIKQDVLILRVAPDSFAGMAEIVRAASEDADFRPRMRLLIDLRGATLGLNYEDMRSLVHSLFCMDRVLAPIWAVLTTSDPYGMSAAHMFSVLARVEDVSSQVFEDEQEALSWLRHANH